MRAKRRNSPRKHFSRQILSSALSLLGLGVLMLAISLSMGPNPMTQAFAKGIRVVVPYALLAGFALLVLYAVLRPKSESDNQERREPPLFGKDTTGFSTALQSESGNEESPPIERGQRAPATMWSARVFDDIEWRRFEALCESLFAQAGFETRAQSHGADGGVDIWLHSRNAEGPAAVVQCKHWLGKPVGVKEMREFFGVMSSHKLHRGTFATTSTFTADARQFAKSNGISALDRQGLLALISTRTPAQQQSLLAAAYEGEYWRPTCASCGVKMVERTARGSKNSFWGCANFPKCRFTLPARSATLSA
jgi:restriction system protein